jgi:hypothetical protein
MSDNFLAAFERSEYIFRHLSFERIPLKVSVYFIGVHLRLLQRTSKMSRVNPPNPRYRCAIIYNKHADNAD